MEVNEARHVLSQIRLFLTPWTIACQAPLFTEFPRQEYWSGFPFPSPGDLPNPGMEPVSPTLQTDSLPSQPLGKPNWLEHLFWWHLAKEMSMQKFFAFSWILWVLYVFKMPGPYQIHDLWILSPILWVVLLLYYAYMYLILMKSNLSVFLLLPVLFCDILKKTCLILGYKDVHLCFLLGFLTSVMSKFLIHFELNFMF